MTTLNSSLVKDLHWQKLTLNADEAGKYLKNFEHYLPQFDLITPSTFKDMEWGVQEVKPIAYVTKPAADFLASRGIVLDGKKTVIIEGISTLSIYVTKCFNWDTIEGREAAPHKKIVLETKEGWRKVIAFNQEEGNTVIELTGAVKPKRPVRA